MIAIQRIVCPVDFSDTSRQALEYATALSRWYGARLTVLHVCSEMPVYEMASAFGTGVVMPPVMLRDIDVAERRESLRRFAQPLTMGLPVDLVVQQGTDVRTEITKQAVSDGADLLVMGTHGRPEFEHLMLGSVTEKVMRMAPCPVIVVPPHAPGCTREGTVVFKRIVCAVDFSDASRRGLDYALDLAQEGDAKLSLVHAIEFPAALREIAMSTDANLDQLHVAAEAEYLRRLRALVPTQARTYCTVASRVTEGKACREIQRVATDEQADLIVMGVQGRGAIDRWVFGSNTHAILRTARCPVLIVPAPLTK